MGATRLRQLLRPLRRAWLVLVLCSGLYMAVQLVGTGFPWSDHQGQPRPSRPTLHPPQHPPTLGNPQAVQSDLELWGIWPPSIPGVTPQASSGHPESHRPRLRGHVPGGRRGPGPDDPVAEVDCDGPAWTVDMLPTSWASRPEAPRSRQPGAGWGARRKNHPSQAPSPSPGMPWGSAQVRCGGRRVDPGSSPGAVPSRGHSHPSGAAPGAPGASSCRPRTHVFFLKVHKSASSTVSNILFRFGEKHGLRFALPAGGAADFSYPRPFQASFVEGFSEDARPHFDILCQHMRFRASEVRRVLPADTFYFTVLRDPARVLESAFAYYKASSPFARARSLGEFLARPRAFYSPHRPDAHYARDPQAFDLGLAGPRRPSPRRLRALVRAVAARFPLVLVAEHLDESLALLGRALCWPLGDLAAFPANRRAAFARSPLSPADVRRARAWSALDWALYRHFNRTLWERLAALGPGVRAEAAALKALRERRARACLAGGAPRLPGALRDPRLTPLSHGLAPILGYELRPGLGPRAERTCRAMATPELQYARRLYRRQFPGAPAGPPAEREADADG